MIRHQTVLLTLLLILAGAAQMPAPITVPPEDAPQTKVVPPEDAPKKKKEATKPIAAKPTPSKAQKHAPGSMDGTWVGEEQTQNGQMVYLLTVTIARNEQTLNCNMKCIRAPLYVRNSNPKWNSDDGGVNYQCERQGDTIRFLEGYFGEMTLQLKADGTILYTALKIEINKPKTLLGSAVLKRQN